jgi:hypothetical protein
MNRSYTALIKQSVAEAAKIRLGHAVASRETVMIEEPLEKRCKPKTTTRNKRKS